MYLPVYVSVLHPFVICRIPLVSVVLQLRVGSSDLPMNTIMWAEATVGSFYSPRRRESGVVQLCQRRMVLLSALAAAPIRR